MPLERGFYEWARLVFGDRMGFLVAWNVGLNATLQVSQIALVTTTYVAYAFGQPGPGENKTAADLAGFMGGLPPWPSADRSSAL
jgi:amino acid transporter